MNMRFYVCSAVTPQNNGLVKHCTARLEAEAGYDYHCPICASPMVLEADGPSVSELLARGLEEEKKASPRA